jgi:RNA polymerase sigma-70 factor (ECF subfamily)
LVFSIVWNYTNNREDADDLSQDVWIKIFLNIDKFKDGNFKVWLVKLCNNVCIDNYRRIKTHKSKCKILEDVDDYDFINIDNSDFETKNLLYSEIFSSLNTLDKSQQDLILLKAQGLKFKEISKILKENRFTVCIRHKLSIMKLIENLEKKGVVTIKKISEIKNRYKTPNNFKVYFNPLF